MKFLKVLSVVFVIIMLSSMFISCAGVKVEFGIEGCFEKKEDVNNPNNEIVDSDEEEQVRYKAKADIKIIDYNHKVLYETDEPFEYDSGFFEPTLVKFIQNYADMNEKKIGCKIGDNGLLASISITKKGVTKTYEAEEKIVSLYDGSEQLTYWICYVNGRMVDSMKETLVKDGDVIEFYYVYPNWDKESIITTEPVVESASPEINPEV